MTSQRIARAAFAACLVVGLGISLSANPSQSTATAHSATFADPRVDLLEGGKVVINVESVGEVKGLLTLNLAPNESGVLTGEWVLSVRYTDNTDPATGVEPPTHSRSVRPRRYRARGLGRERLCLPLPLRHAHVEYAESRYPERDLGPL